MQPYSLRPSALPLPPSHCQCSTFVKEDILWNTFCHIIYDNTFPGIWGVLLGPLVLPHTHFEISLYMLFWVRYAFLKVTKQACQFRRPLLCRGTILWTSGRGLGGDVSWSREITYKNRCIICQFAMWLPGRESGRTAAELPCQSCWTAAELPLLELPDCHQSSPTRAGGELGRHSGNSGGGASAEVWQLSSRCTIPFSMSRFNPDFRSQSQSSFPPNSFSPLREILHYESLLVVEVQSDAFFMIHNIIRGAHSFRPWYYIDTYILPKQRGIKKKVFSKSYFKQIASKTCFLELIYYVYFLGKHHSMSPLINKSVFLVIYEGPTSNICSLMLQRFKYLINWTL